MFEFGGNDVRAVSGNLSEDIAYKPVSEEIANKILQDFSEKNENSSMRVSFDELSNAIIKEYVANEGKKDLANQEGEAMNNLLNYYRIRAKEFGIDGECSIEEYESMFKEKFAQAEKELKNNKMNKTNKTNSSTKQDETICESSAVKFEKTFETGKKSAEIVDKFVQD